MKKIRYLVLFLMILIVLSGCGSIPGKAVGISATPILLTQTLEAITRSVTIGWTPEPEGTSLPLPEGTLPAGELSTIHFPQGGGLIVGLSEQGKTVIMHIGDRFLLQLGDNFDWTVTSSDESVIGRVTNLLVIHGAQGLYDGRKIGKAILNAVGDPKCRSSQPACMAPSMIYFLHVQVEP